MFIDVESFQRENIFLLTMNPANKYFLRVPAHAYLTFLVTGAKASRDVLTGNDYHPAHGLTAQNQMEHTMHRNTTVGSLPLGLSRRLLATCSASLAICLIAFCALALFGGLSLRAQVAGDGAINGRVTDPSGAVVQHAKVTATNTDTGVSVTRETTSSGDYSISPLQAGNYNVEVIMTGFKRQFQENVQVDSLQKVGLDVKLTVGGSDTTVTVSDAPPSLDTTNATLGGTIENELYTELPLSMGGSPRDPTAFQYLMPGVQEGPPPTSAGGLQQGVYGGTGQTNLNENYIEGVPVSNIQSQGDNSPVAKAVSVDAVDQFSVQTNGASTAFGGAGVTNYTIKSGGNQFHGTIFDYVRNTMFDTWGYFSKVPSPAGFAEKPGEHQNSYGGSLGGPIIKDKLFFFGTYEGFHYTKTSNTPQVITIPTLAERTGDFTDQYGTVNAGIFDPINGGRSSGFQAVQNGVPTLNVIPQSEIADQSLYLQQALPAPTSLSTVNNYLAGLPIANSDYTIDARIDYTVTTRHKLSITGVAGNRGFAGEPNYSNTSKSLPQPYALGTFENDKTATGVVAYTYVISQTLINALRYGFTRTWGEKFSISNGTKFNSTAAGIKNLPPGNASNSMPSITFSQGPGTAAIPPINWGSSPSSGNMATNSYTIIDNLQWIKGRHNFTFGLQVQWLQTNQPGNGFGGTSNVLSLTASGYETSGQDPKSQGVVMGSAYASYLVGAYRAYAIPLQSISDTGGRFRPDALYIQDDWRFSPKLTLNLGIRYDYLQPYHEVKDRIAFLNPNLINPIVGIPGVLEYAGFGAGPNPAYSPYICQCTTPVKPYNNNFEPRIGFAYAKSAAFVVRGGFGLQLTHGGATGGGSNFTGTGNNGEFGNTAGNSQGGSSVGALPEIFLNDKIPASAQGISVVNSSTQADYSSFPTYTLPSANVNPLASTGNYNFTTLVPGSTANLYNCNTSDGSTCNAQAQNYADPYYGGRGPQYIDWNLGFQQMINKKAVLSVNYAGSASHFLGGGSGRGYATNAISPDYSNTLRALLASSAGAAQSAVQAILPNYKLPYPGFTGSGSSATVARSLSAFPQYGGFTDLYSATGNSNYNSLQVSVIQRPWHNLSGFVNYTRSKSIDDTHGHRTQYPVGPQDGNFTQNYSANAIDRGLGTFNQTNAFNLTWVYSFPFGRGQAFFATNRIMGLIAGGWQLSGIYKYRDGSPLHITNQAGCATASNALQGTCFPDYAPGFDKRSARINGRWGRGPGANAANINTIQYLNPAAFLCPDSPTFAPTLTCGAGGGVYTSWKLGNAASSAPDGLTGPGWWDIDLGIRRTFVVIERPTLHLTFQVEGDVINSTNSTFFNVSSTGWNNNCNAQSSSSTCNLAYGAIGGQNVQIPPRDWQFAGRFRF
jgi:Carboxypeptidase regulatory-like domain